jgi:hypothetical protein
LLDLLMPGISGRETAAALKEHVSRGKTATVRVP